MQDEHLLEEGGQVALELKEAGYRVARAKDYSWKVSLPPCCPLLSCRCGTRARVRRSGAGLAGRSSTGGRHWAGTVAVDVASTPAGTGLAL